MIYLDYAAATPVDKEVLSRYIEVTNKYFANPNSSHQLGQEANNIIQEATKRTLSECLCLFIKRCRGYKRRFGAKI